ncbi:hypothetical protein PLANPX_5211 [Lacipirellula parvula]|uniref:Uncharacterized protein n=1 Tax=Lacipirellula parvula TaxID=2650471 RepID=A0A5K7XQ13_9BACT|nr:hypothetical protein PLANPX_5211 [Lacipirellula parvula]
MQRRGRAGQSEPCSPIDPCDLISAILAWIFSAIANSLRGDATTSRGCDIRGHRNRMRFHQGVRLEKILLGMSGQYFVAAELSRRAYFAVVALRNAQGIDIVASTTDGAYSVGI